MKNKKWHLNPKEVAWGQSALNLGGRGNIRNSRQLDYRRVEISLTHIPTGLAIKETIPTVHNSKRELQRLRDNLMKEMFKKLELIVARHLHFSGI